MGIDKILLLSAFVLGRFCERQKHEYRTVKGDSPPHVSPSLVFPFRRFQVFPAARLSPPVDHTYLCTSDWDDEVLGRRSFWLVDFDRLGRLQMGVA